MLRFPVISGDGSFELTPLLSSTEYPWQETSYMPFLTARFAYIAGEGARFELSSFDTEPYADPAAADPLGDSLVAAVFDYFPAESDTALAVVANAFDRCALYRDGKPAGTLPCLRSSGEDERGIYWAVRFTVPCALLREVYGKDMLQPGDTLTGNIFKAKRTGPGAHLGAVAPASADGFLFDKESRAPFTAFAL